MAESKDANLVSAGDLPAAWRQRAQFIQDFGDPNSARLWQVAAVELEQALRTLGDETLTLVEAARITGYSPDHLGNLVRKGKIPNRGRKNAPRVRRADLPTKSAISPGRPPSRMVTRGAMEIASIADKLRQGRGGNAEKEEGQSAAVECSEGYRPQVSRADGPHYGTAVRRNPLRGPHEGQETEDGFSALYAP